MLLDDRRWRATRGGRLDLIILIPHAARLRPWRNDAESSLRTGRARRRGCRSASATGPSRTQNKPDGETVRRVIRPLTALRECPNGGEPPADQPQVERRDRHATDDTPGGLASARQSGGHDRRPADRDREMNGHRGGQQHRCTPLMREQHRAGGAAPLQHVLASDQRPHRGGNRRTRRSSQPGCQRVARESSSKTTPHTTIVSGPGLLFRAPKRRSSTEALASTSGPSSGSSGRRPLRGTGSSRHQRAA